MEEKHQPVLATIKITQGKPKEPRESLKIERRLNKKALQDTCLKQENARKAINEVCLNDALQGINRTGAQQSRAHNRKTQIWFDAECYQERTKILHKLHKAQHTANPRDLYEYG
ncbi:hypothetical protein C0J52_13093 [Blattella germanica]|nr:hypothetical protein C0J52_13093 [Blattella germanica]